MEELEILENQNTRENLMERVKALDKVKELILLPYGDCMTRKQVAEYYEVDEETIKKIATKNITELTNNGMTKLKGEELKNFKSNFDRETLSLSKLNKANRELNIFTRRAILNIGMLLTIGNIAKQVRAQLLNMSEHKESIKEETQKIDKEKLLTLDVVYATDENSRLLALSRLNTYKDEQKKKIEEERDIAKGKVENLTKSDATFGIREAKNNLGVGEKKLTTYLTTNKYCYRTGKSNKLKAYAPYTLEPTRYFTEITQVDRIGNPHTQTVITIDGIEYFRTLKDEINK